MGSQPLDDAPVLGTKRKYGQVKKEIDKEELHICGTNRFRKVPPADYLFRIESFSLIWESGLERLDTKYFKSGDKKWKLSIHPGRKADVGGHVSLSLAIEEPSNSTPSWEINVNVKFFVLDQIRGQYLIIPDAFGEERRFDWMKLEWCFPNLISHDTMNDPSKGYLVNDCCVFGVEVFVLGNTREGETFTLFKQPKNGLYAWRIDKYSTLGSDCLYSPVFSAEGQQWKLMLYPKGNQNSDGKHLSIFLEWVNIPPERKGFAHCILRLKNQINNHHHEHTVVAEKGWWEKPNHNKWGYPDFMLLNCIKEGTGYVVNDGIIIEAELTLMSVVKGAS
ncbi:hypothetical protein Tsubulata_001100 [Turnera subulata]|uniref:MATH domain-containing protein n=1 Tax=Turnera subulata TaxID=218843 RepID=A0A9Q0G2E3_9ROSI|nr:hypothetical protein Tsubulata_001100 [Turnera subulata]